MGLLKIQETQDLDAGDYTCVAINEAGRATGRLTLDVGCKLSCLLVALFF